jgi:hypothetical protein
MDRSTAGHVGKIDRIVRIVLGLVLLGFALACPFAKSLGDAVVWGSGIVGLVLLGTALIRFCPLYRMLGICS